MTAAEWNEKYPTGAKAWTEIASLCWMPCKTTTLAFTDGAGCVRVGVVLTISHGHSVDIPPVSRLRHVETAGGSVMAVWENRQLMAKWGNGILSGVLEAP